MADHSVKKSEEEEFSSFAGANSPASEAADKKLDREFDAFQSAAGDFGDQLIATGQSALGSLVETAPAIGGLVAGAAITAPIPIPFSTVAGAASGFAAGALAGGYLRDELSEINIPGTDIPFTYKSVADFPEGQREAAVVGEVFGGGSPFALAFLGMAKAGVRVGSSYIGNYINRVFDSIARSPGTYLAAETAGMTGAAVAGATSEAVLPGNLPVRITGEVVGGFFNPTRLMLGFADSIKNIFKRVAQAVMPSAQQSRAAEVVFRIVEEAGDDPILLAKLLESSGFPGIGDMTSAAKTGNEALIALQSQLIRKNGKFSKEAGALTQANLDNIDRLITALRSSGDTEALSKVARLQVKKFKILITGNVHAAEREAHEMAAKITKDTPVARMKFSAEAHTLLNDVRVLARDAEHAAWEAIPGAIRVRADDVVEEYALIAKKLAITGSEMPKEIRFFVDKINAPGSDGTMSMLEMIEFRKEALVLAADAAASTSRGAKRDARFYGLIAESVLDSMDTTFGKPGSARAGLNRLLRNNADAYDTARQLSREINDTFLRTFAGHALEKTRKGSNAVPPELMLPRALGTGGDAAALRLDELEQATEFISTHGLAVLVPDLADATAVMTGLQQRLLRLAAAESIETSGELVGRVSATKLQAFIDKNPVLMKRFPDIATDLKAAVKSEDALKSITRSSAKSTRIIEQQAAFSEVAKVDNSVAAVSSAIGNVNPERKLAGLVKLAKKGGYHAMEGLRSSAFDFAIDKATTPNGGLSYKVLREVFTAPLQAGGNKTLMSILQDSGVLAKADGERLLKVLDEADRIVKSGRTLSDLDDAFLGEMDALTELIIRGAGSTAATKGARALGVSSSGPTLVIAGAGSRAALRIMDKVPNSNIRAVLIEAMKDPKFMAMLLRKPQTPKDALRLNQQLHAYMYQAGFFGLNTAEEDEEDLPVPVGP